VGTGSHFYALDLPSGRNCRQLKILWNQLILQLPPRKVRTRGLEMTETDLAQ